MAMHDRPVPAATPDIAIHPLIPDRWDDLAALFQEGGDPKWCWLKCQVGRVPGR
jgi:hypothetical protein